MSLLEDRHQQALNALSSGNIVSAISLLRENLVETEKVHGSESLETAQSLFTLGLCLFQSDRSRPMLAEVDELVGKALHIRRTLKGEVDASVAITSEFQASVCQLLGNFEKAENLFRLSLENAEKLVGQQHPNTAKAQYGLASVLIGSNTKMEEATGLLEKCVETRRRVFGPNSPESVQAITALARVWELRGNGEKALELMSEAHNLEQLIDRSSVAAPNQQAMR
jgi:tetratricopeptide (TPR) repeat protein